ncbi:MAG: aldehyde dehydrogenase family protein [Novosphingobium sp.]|jgi:aldehyde dehydrogenase (NAD+)|nr:aldehyde dehydrogenase family protein [Novosphingobium sp.]
MSILPDALLYIDGKLRPATGGGTFAVISPWTARPVGMAADASRGDVEEAIAAAYRAFHESDWAADRERRVALLEKLYVLMVANRDRLVALARHEVGAALGAVGRAQVDLALGGFRDLLDLFPQVEWEADLGERGPPSYVSHRKLRHEPVGVVAAITPWNAPLYINTGKCVAALLAGCTVVLKPAPDTPGMGAILGELAAEAGFPAGVFNVVTSADPAMAGEMLVDDRRVDLISFTGSTATGRRIAERGAKTLKRVFLELGGKSAKVVFEDAPGFAQEVAASMVVSHAGQGCAIMTRLLVPRSRYGEAVEALRGAYAAYGDNWGDFDGEGQMMGPVVNASQLARVKAYIDLGVEEGATLLAGGRLRPDKGSGYFVEPTCFVDVTNGMRIAQEEIFGPVLVVIPFEDEDDAVRIANDSEYGLSGGVFSADTERAMRVAERIRTGSVMVNGGLCIAGDLPFGGYKASGIGREWGKAGIEEFLEAKVIAWRVA